MFLQLLKEHLTWYGMLGPVFGVSILCYLGGGIERGWSGVAAVITVAALAGGLLFKLDLLILLLMPLGVLTGFFRSKKREKTKTDQGRPDDSLPC